MTYTVIPTLMHYDQKYYKIKLLHKIILPYSASFKVLWVGFLNHPQYLYIWHVSCTYKLIIVPATLKKYRKQTKFID